ncbi:MAG: hypothetical protein IJP50_02800 [Paludibacteraceae bacterium]|nr:hypothetical protein [Paludibacteraceae bacterium]
MKKLIPSLIIMASLTLSACQRQSEARFETKEFVSEYLCKNPRRVEILLPKDYDTNKNERYAVLYMYDCQNIFHDSLSYTGISWGVKETVETLTDSGVITPLIVVGIDNAGELRGNEYSPKKLVQRIREKDPHYFDGKGDYLNNDSLLYSDEFLKFVVSELKPYIDSTYRTLPDRENTAIMGSSLGGLMSLYAVLEYPDVFGKAACISTHWPVNYGDNTTTGTYAYAELVAERWDEIIKPEKLYFDYGTETTDAGYINKQPIIDSLFTALEYPAANYYSKCFEGKDHSERSWRERLPEIMKFLWAE